MLCLEHSVSLMGQEHRLYTQSFTLTISAVYTPPHKTISSCPSSMTIHLLASLLLDTLANMKLPFSPALTLSFISQHLFQRAVDLFVVQYWTDTLLLNDHTVELSPFLTL